MKEIDDDNREAFEVFCNLHPIEAYDLNPDEFCKYFRSYLGGSAEKYPDQEIKKLIDESRNL